MTGKAVLKIAVVLGVLMGVCAGNVNAQIPGPNVNMVSGTSKVDGDPFLQRQNEPSIAVSTRNPCHLLAGANDYRTVELPGLPGDQETGDAWLGVFKSFDCGRTWKSTLIPGYPQDPLGASSPLFGLTAGADPMVRAGTNGLFYYSGLVFNRGAHQASKVFVARFIDNNTEIDAQGHRVDPITYIGTSVVDQGTGGQFIDKPSIAVDVPRGGHGGHGPSCMVAGQRLAAGTVYAVYSTFVGNTQNNTTRLMVSQSSDCGTTWSTPLKISEGVHTNQGAVVAVAPDGTVYVAWRQFASGNQPDAILIARSTDGGASFSRAATIATIFPFDQGTSGASFRTNTYPTMAIDGQNRVYVAWSARGFATRRPDPITGDARIVMSVFNGTNWSDPQAVDDSLAAEEDRGHQIMPALTYAAGRLQLIYYDLRDDQTYLDYVETNGTYSGEGHRKAIGDRKNNSGNIFDQWIADDSSKVSRRHDVNVRGMQWSATGAVPSGGSWRISQYAFGVTLDPETMQPSIRQVEFNPPNLPLYAKGTAPFLGDYIDVAGVAFVPTAGGGWAFNTNPDGPHVFHAVWTDNRDVRPPKGDKTWADYTPAGSVNCDPTNPTTGLRNSNIYTSLIAPSVTLSSPGNAKAVGTAIPAAFPVVVANQASQTVTYRVHAVAPADGRASFVESTLLSTAQPPPSDIVDLDVTIPARSSVARTVFVTAPSPTAQATVEVRQQADSQLMGTLVFNADPTSPSIRTADITNQAFNPDIMNPDIMNPDIMNPDIMNPDIMNPDIMNPDIMNPDIMNPDIMNPVINPDIMNPDIMNPDIMNPDIMNPDIMNPDIMNRPATDAVLTDITWTIKNNGNTAASYSLTLLAQRALPQGFASQLIVHKRYVTPAVGASCDLAARTQENIIANIVNPFASGARAASRPAAAGVTSEPPPGDVTIALAPGEQVKVTLRVLDPDYRDNTYKQIDGRWVSVDPQFSPVTDATPQVEAQAVNVTSAGPDPTPIVVNPSMVTFAQEPTLVTQGVAISPAVKVRVTDSSGAVLPGVAVALSLAQNPGSAALTNASASTDPTGVATFTGLTVSAPGVGYRIEAAVTVGGAVYTGLSAPFDVMSPPRPGPALRQLAANNKIPLSGLPTNFSVPTGDTTNAAGDYAWGSGRGSLFYKPAGQPAGMLLQPGDPVPGIVGSVAMTLGTVKMNSLGNASVDVDFYASGYFQHVILVYDRTARTFRTIAYSEDIAPGTAVKFGRGLAPFGFNDSGTTAFTAGLVPPLTTPSHTTIFIAPAVGPIVKLAGWHDAAPGTGGGIFESVSPIAFNSAGEVLFRASVVGGSGGAGLFVASIAAGVRKVVATGDTDPGTGGTFTFTSAPSGVLNRWNQVAFWVGNFVYIGAGGAAPVVALSTGHRVAAPLAGSITRFNSTPAFNDEGDFVFSGRVFLDSTHTNTDALLEARPSGVPGTWTDADVVIAAAGFPAPGLSPRTISGFGPSTSGYALNNVGTTLFWALLDGGTDYVLYKRLADGTTTIVAQTDQTIPSLGGRLFGQPNYHRLYDNESVYLESYLVGGSADYAAFWATGSGTTVLTSTADPLPSEARVLTYDLWIGAAGHYVAYNATRAGGATAIFSQAIGATPVRAVADGDTVAGAGTARLRIMDAAGLVPVNASGAVAFRSEVEGQVGNSVFAWTPTDGIRKVVSPGDTVPGTTYSFTNASVVTSSPRSPLNDSGQVLFSGTWSVPSSRTGLFVARPGSSPVKIVAQGDAVPGMPAGVTFGAPGTALMNAFGQAAFMAQITGGQTGIFVGGGGLALTPIVLTGDSLGGGLVEGFTRAPHAFNDSGFVAFYATLTGGAGAGLFIGSASAAPTPVALNGDLAPGGGFYNFTPTSLDVRMNNAGDIVFIAPLSGGGSGLFLRPAGAATVLIAREGDAAPGTTATFGPIAWSLNSIPGENLALGPTGEVMFFTGVNIGGNLVYGWFRYRNGVLEKILMRGDPMPGCNGLTVVALSQGAGAGSPGRFTFRIATTDGTNFRDMIYTTALASDPVEGCMVSAGLLSRAPALAESCAPPTGKPTLRTSEAESRPAASRALIAPLAPGRR